MVNTKFTLCWKSHLDSLHFSKAHYLLFLQLFDLNFQPSKEEQMKKCDIYFMIWWFQSFYNKQPESSITPIITISNIVLILISDSFQTAAKNLVILLFLFVTVKRAVRDKFVFVCVQSLPLHQGYWLLAVSIQCRLFLGICARRLACWILQSNIHTWL